MKTAETKFWPKIFLFLLLVLAVGLPNANAALLGQVSSTNKYAWSESSGWQNFQPTDGGVTIYTDHLSGYAWAANVGWIKLGSAAGGPYANTSSSNWGVNRDAATGNLSGYAWSETVGWITFQSSLNQVNIDPVSGDFSGYAWSGNVGYIHFNNASPAYKVQAVTLTEGLIAYYPFNGNANDESGNDHNGTVNGATLVPDRFGEASNSFSFDGSNDYIVVSDSPDLRLDSSDFTISVWAKLSGYGGQIMAKRQSGSANGWSFGVSGGPAPYTGKVGFQICGGSDPQLLTSEPIPLDLAWHHILVTFDRDSQIATFYVDGIKDTSANIYIPNLNVTSDLFIGRDSNSSVYYYNGEYDDIRIYNRALSASEIQALYTLEAPASTPLFADSDGDGVPDSADICPGGNDSVDSDNDSVPDYCDAFPNNGSYTTDTDEDGMPDDWENTNGLEPNTDDAGDDADGDGLTNLQEFLNGSDPNYNLSQYKILFVQDEDNGNDIYLMDGEYTNVIALTNTSGNATGYDYGGKPIYISAINRIIFHSNRDGWMDWENLYSMNLDGSDVKALTTDDNRHWYYDVDQTNQLIYYLYNSGSNRIDVMNVDGSNKQTLPWGYGKEPWAVNQFGQLLYWHESDANTIRRINTDGTGDIVVASDTGYQWWAPSWSHDGNRFIATRLLTGHSNSREVWVMDADGSNKAKVEIGSLIAHPYFPRFMPDEQKIIFSAREPTSSNYDLYLANLDGSGLENITNTPDISEAQPYPFIPVDTTAPNAPVVTSSSPITNTTTPTWTWSSGGNGGNGTYRYKLDSSDLTSGATETATAAYTATALSDASHTLYVQERDAAGNWSASGSYAVIVDTTGPAAGAISINAGAAYTKAAAVNLALSCTDTGGVWETKASLPGVRSGAAGEAVAGRLYVAGGSSGSGATNTLLAYDPSANVWETKASMQTPRSLASAAEINGQLYVVGGWLNSDSNSPTNVLEIYNPANNTWASGPTMPTSRGAAVAAGMNGKLYVTGGSAYQSSEAPQYAQLEIYDGSSWTTGAALPTARENAAGVALNGKLYVIGGFIRTYPQNSPYGYYTGIVEVYDPASNTWSTKTPMPTARYAAAAGVINGQIHVIGGSNNSGKVNTHEIYDPPSDTWSTVAPLSVSRSNLGSGVIDGKLYAAAGGSSSALLNMLEVFTPQPGSGCAGMLLSNVSNFSGAVEENFAANKTWTLASADGAKAVYVKFKDAVGNWSAACNDTIILDTTGPAVTPSVAGGTFTSTQTVTLVCNDSFGSGCGTIFYTNDSTTPTTSSRHYASPIIIAATTTLKFFANDSAGNSSSVQTEAYTIDTVAPNAAVVSSAAALTTNTTPTWTWTSGGGGGNGTYRYKLDSNDSGSGTTETTTASYTPGTALSDGSHVLYVQERDAAGNWSASGSFAVTVDTIGPLGGGASGAFAATGSMSATRAYHAATLLASGKVLISGGENASGSVLVAELYDPATGQFAASGSLNSGRAGHSAVLLPSGKVLLVGGNNYSGAALNSAELYDPANGAFTVTGSMSVARYYGTATLLTNGTVLITGGANGSTRLNSAELYDPATGAFTPTGNMLSRRFGDDATLLANGKVLITGGYNENDLRLNTAELYDPATGIFTATGSMSSARNNQEGVLLADGKVLIAGSWNGSASLSAAELYDPATATFAATGSMTSARSGQKVTLLPNGKVLLTGGWSGGTQTGSAEIYDPAKGVFSATAGMSIGRQLHTATLLANGKVLITGGLQGSTLHSSAELYTPAADAIAINANAVAGNTISVTLALAATDASGVSMMLVSNDSLFSGAVAEIYATSKSSWTLSSGDGTKAVYVKFKDAVGNWSAAYNDTIILDTSSPAIAPSLAGGTFNAAQSVTLSCNDSSGSGCGSIYYTNDSSTPTTSSFLYSRPITISASTTLKYIAIDRAGNSSPVQTTTYTIDTSAPNAPVVSSAASPTNNNKPTWTWTSGGGGGNGTYRYKLDSNDSSSGTTETTTVAYTPGTMLSDGLHALYVQERDAAGNWSAAGNFVVMVDTVGPIAVPQQLPQTGQTTCYDVGGAVISCAGTGQDGEMQAGATWPNPRFSNQDGTTPISGDIILDKLSGLEWLKDGGTPTVGSCTGGAKTWTAALNYVVCLNTANYLGHNDWRLPNINELESLVNAGQSDLPAWLNGQGFTNVQLSRYWSSTTFSSDASVAYYVGMYDGGLQYGGLVAADAKYYNFYIWPVRSEQCSASGNSVNCLPRTGQTISYATGDDGDLEKGVSWPAPRFTDKGDQTVVDNLTSLTWTKDAQAPGPSACGPGTTKTWLAALNYVACLNTNNYLDHNDWRLPNRKELNSLADYSKISPYISIGHPFSNLQASSYWSSSTFVHDTNNAWRVDLNGGYVGGSNKSDSYYVWPVRGGLSGGPAITINSNATSTNTTSVTLTLSATDANIVSKMMLSNAPLFTNAVEENDSTSKSWTLSSGDGVKTVYAKFKDAAGNWSPVYNDSIILDSTGPTVTPSPAGGTFNATQTVTLTCNDSSGAGCGTIHYTTDGTTPTTASLRYATPLTISASTTLKYFANDSAGNSGQVQTTTYTIDAVAPDTTISGNPAQVTNITSATFTFSASEAATFECKLDSGAWTTCTSPQDYAALSVAGHTFQVRAKDTAGNYDPSPASATWTIDQTGPTGGITINAGATSTNSTAVTLGLSASDANGLSTMMLSNDSNFSGAAEVSCIDSKSWTLASGDGVKTVYAKFKDAAGNWSPVYNDSITLDRTGPDTFITSQPANPSNSTSASFSFTADEANSTFRCQLDSNGYSSCTSPQTYSGLAAGSHSFSVRGQDAVGNNDSTPESYTWTIDTSAPNAPVVSSATAITNNNKPTWTWTSGGGGGNGTYRYKLDSNDSSSGTTETTTASYTPGTALADGSHRLYVQERNAAGNWSASGSFAVMVDTVEPVGGSVSGQGSFAATGNLSSARQQHAAVRLQNGKVLVAGGVAPSGSSVLSSAELYDPATGTFTTTGTMRSPRYAYTATLLLNGKVLLAGGYPTTDGSSILSSAELYDPATGTFTTTGSMSSSRGAHTATLLPNGKVLVTGGHPIGNGAVSSADLYDPATGAFTATGNMSAARANHTASLLANGKVLIAGGDSGGAPYNSADLYDPSTGAFTATGSMNVARYSHVAAVLPNGNVLVAGGNDNGNVVTSTAELYNPATGAFTSTGSMGAARYLPDVMPLPNGSVLVTGGWQPGVAVLSSAELYSVTTGTFTAISSMSTARFCDTATLLANGNVLFAGGWGSSGAISSAELFIPAADAISINSNATSTNTTSVTLTLSATDANGVSKMMLSNAPSFTSAVEENDSTSKSWTLSSGDGTKTVYAKFKDDAGNWSRVYNDSITLDSTGPTVTPSPAGGTFTTTQTVTLACNDSTGTGCGSIHYTIDGATPTTASLRYSMPITIAATTILKFFANDSAGNSGQVQTTTYTIQGFNITGGATIHAVQGDTRSTNLTLTSYGDYSQAADLTYAWVGTTPTDATVNITPASITPTPSGAAADVSFTADANTPAGAYTLRITATSGTMVNTADILVNVSAPLTISTTTLAAGTKGQTYTPTVSATGGVGAYTFSRTSGVLPAGLTLNSNGSFNGTASTRGTYTFTVQANDSDGHTVSQAYDVRIYDNAYRKIVLEATSWTVQQPAASGFIYVKVMDDYVAYVTMTANTNIMVSSSSNTGLFSTDGINWSSSNTISATISSGTSSTYFFYKDSNAGAFTITAAGINGQATEAWEQTSQTITMNEAVISQYALAVNKSGLGAGTVSTSSGTLLWNDSTGRATYASGSSVILTATAGSDSAFASWSGCTSVNSNQCTVTMSADRNVTVTFNDITPPTAPGVSSTANLTNNDKPTWTWSSGGNGGNGAYRYKLDSPDLSSGATETSTASYTPATALSDALHTLYVQERDAAGNWSLSGSFALTVDTTGPTGTITINANDASTKDTAVILTLSASDASDIAKMMLGNDSSFANAVAENDSSSKAWSLASGDGSKTVYVKFQDRAGNWSGVYSDTITLDQSAPTLTIDAPSKTLTGNDAVTYTITYSGADTISLTSGDITLHTTGTANGSKAVSGTGNSSRTITISGITGNGALGISLAAGTGQDAAGNQTASAGPSATVAVDTTKPAVNAGSDQTKNAQFIQTATANDSNTMTYTWTKLTGTGTITFGTPTALSTTISADADGTYTLRFTAMDAAGNSNHSDLTLAWDSGAPTLSISAPSATLTRNSDITYIVTYSGAEAITLTNDSISLHTTGTASATKAVSGEGTTTRTVTLSNIMGDGTLGITIAAATANDSAGNLAVASGASATFTVDNTKPVVNAGTDQSRSAQFTQIATANDSTPMTYTWTKLAGDGTITFGTPNAGSTTISADADGTYILRFTAIDAAGNSNHDDLDLLWDTGAPTLSLNAPSATLTRNSDITYTITYSNADTITLTNDSITLLKTGTASATKAVSGIGTATRMVTISNISGDGTLGLSIAAGTASDTAGNLALASGASSTFTVDNTKPVVNAGANQSRNAEFTQTATANDSNAMTYAWTKEAGTGTITFGTPTARSTTISANAEGAYTLRFTAIDAVGNSNFSDLTLVWDTTNPSGTISINDNDSYSKTAAVTLTLACTDSNGCAEMRFSNDGVFSAAPVPSAPTAPWTLAAGTDGLRTVMVKFKDTVGNWSGSYNDTITLDTVAPVTTISAKPSNPSRLATADFSFNAEADASYQCRIDSDEYATCSSPQNYPDLAEGSHTFSVKATDLAGNTQTTPASFTWTIDTGVAAPTGLDLATADDTGLSNSDNITKNSTGLTISGSGENGAVVQLYDNGNPLNNAIGTVSGVGFSLDVALAAGLHHITAVQNDSAGNVSPASAELTITVDQDLPVVAVTNPESGRKAKPMELSGNLSDMLSDIATAEVQVTYTNDQGALRYLKYFYPQGYWDFSSSETWIPVENTPRTGGIWFVDLEWFFSMSRITVWSTGTTYQIKVRATDSAGNLGISASNHTFIYGEPDSIITASAGAGGSITPAGQTTLTSGASKMFTITPEQCSAINDVRLDDNSVFDDLVDKGLGKTYTYINSVTGNHTINATFTDQGRSSIIASAGSGGSIWPSGDVTVCGMQDQAFTITPQEGYELLELRIDNQPVALAASYTFTDVTADHAIDAVFARKTYTITASASEHGSITPSGVSIVEHGGSRSFTITPELCYDGNVYIDGDFRLLQNDTYVFSNVMANHTIQTNFALICSSGATNLTFDLSSQAILLNGTVDVAGKLSLVNHDVNLDLRGLSIKIRITAPDGSNRTLQTTTINFFGDFIINGMTGFTEKGLYTMEAIFETSGALQRAEAVRKTLLVGSKAGYAILVQGRISSNEGLLSHNLTARRTYKRLLDRGFTAEDIMYLGFSEVGDGIIDGVPSLPTLQNAIENWAAAAMNDSPAPLYLIMVDHGGRDKFYIGADYVTPTALNSWLNAMEAKLSSEAGNESRVVIIGSCYSGSFISALSKEGRAIITSSAADEVSWKGPKERDEKGEDIRSGEFFLDELFQQLWRGENLMEAFEAAVGRTEKFTDKGGGESQNSKEDNQFFDLAQQHPLLDDNSDHLGSNELQSDYGDGAAVHDIYLGAGLDYDTNSLGNPADILAVANTGYLNDSSTTAKLWLRANDNNEVGRAWAEIRSPASGATTVLGGTEQATLELPRLFLTLNDATGLYEASYNGFTASGAYDIFYFVRDQETEALSSMWISTVYKNRSGNTPPANFSLVAPSHQTTPSYIMIFDWQNSTDADGLTYTLTIAADLNFQNIVHRQERLDVSMAYTDEKSGLQHGETYWWKVEAIDSFGARTSSVVWSFTVQNPNSLPAIIKGRVYDPVANQSITGATINISSLGNFLAGDLGLFIMIVQPNVKYQATCSAPGYPLGSVNDISLSQGEIRTLNFEMLKQNVSVDETAPTVAALPAGGIYTGLVNVQLSCDDGAGSGCAAIYYTLDGTEPSTVSAQYTAPIAVTDNLVIKFFAKDQAGNSSALQTANYTVQPLPGDVDGSGHLDLADAILVLKIINGKETSGIALNKKAEVNGDQKIGLQELQYIMQRLAGVAR